MIALTVIHDYIRAGVVIRIGDETEGIQTFIPDYDIALSPNPNLLYVAAVNLIVGRWNLDHETVIATPSLDKGVLRWDIDPGPEEDP